MMPGTEPMKWTSSGTFKWILDGHFLQEDVRVEFAGSGSPAMVFRNYYGWDRIQKKLVSYTVGSSGEMHAASHVTWLNDKTLLVLGSSIANGAPVINRTVLTSANGEWGFKMQAASGADDFVTIVAGTIKPSGSPYAISDAELAAGVAPASDSMRKIQSICGSYSMKGKMEPVPGAPMMEISAKETIRSIFNGTILQMHVKGDPTPGAGGFQYEGIAYLKWNPTTECYDQFYLNNWGETSTSEMRWVDDRSLVSTQTGVQYGQPDASRVTLKLSEAGTIQTVSMDRMSANNAAVRAFWGEYKKTAKSGKAGN